MHEKKKKYSECITTIFFKTLLSPWAFQETINPMSWKTFSAIVDSSAIPWFSSFRGSVQREIWNIIHSRLCTKPGGWLDFEFLFISGAEYIAFQIEVWSSVEWNYSSGLWEGNAICQSLFRGGPLFKMCKPWGLWIFILRRKCVLTFYEWEFWRPGFKLKI